MVDDLSYQCSKWLIRAEIPLKGFSFPGLSLLNNRNSGALGRTVAIRALLSACIGNTTKAEMFLSG